MTAPRSPEVRWEQAEATAPPGAKRHPGATTPSVHAERPRRD
jgi:hypothetical protein